MNKKKLEEFQELLQEQMDQLLLDAGKTVSEMTDEKTNFELRIRDRERRLIGKIREALDRIEAGDFGECEDCGDQIGEARLKARPVTTLCIECKTEQERQEKIG
jgi:DnaK suppressor protein